MYLPQVGSCCQLQQEFLEEYSHKSYYRQLQEIPDLFWMDLYAELQEYEDASYE